MDQFATGATTKDLEAIAARVAPYGWHIEINFAKSADLADLEPRLRRCPVPLVFDHLGRVRGGEGVNAAGFKSSCANSRNARIAGRKSPAGTACRIQALPRAST